MNQSDGQYNSESYDLIICNYPKYLEDKKSDKKDDERFVGD